MTYAEKRRNAKRSKIIRKLEEMAFGRANDAVKLVVREEPLTDEELREMDLTMLSEVKRGSGGSVEIKLVNRLEVIRMLLDELTPPKEDGAEGFFAAMERAAHGDTE